MSDGFTTFEATATEVTHKDLKRKSDGRSFVLYTVQTTQGEFTTAKRDLAQEAHSLIGRPAMFQVKTEQRGEFTNYYLESVSPLSNGNNVGQVDQSGFGSPAPTQQGPAPAQQAPVGVPANEGPSGKDVFIFRQTAAKVAAQLSAGPTEFWSNIDDLVDYFKTGAKPGSMPNQYVPEAALAAPDMSGVGASGGGGSYQHTDDDIPF